MGLTSPQDEHNCNEVVLAHTVHLSSLERGRWALVVLRTYRDKYAQRHLCGHVRRHSRKNLPLLITTRR